MSYEYEQPTIDPESVHLTMEQIETANHFLEAYQAAHAELARLQTQVKQTEERVQQAVRDLGSVAGDDPAMQAWLVHRLYWDQDPVRVSLIAEAFGIRNYDVQQFAKLNVPCERCGRPIREPSRQQGLLYCRTCEHVKHTQED